MAGKKELKIRAIRSGIVIDHITRGKAPEVLKILGIDESFPNSVTIAMNVPSRVLGRKDIVKVENRDIADEEINKIAVIAPFATINKIRNYKVVEKRKVELPGELIGILKCPNPNCVSNKEREPIKPHLFVERKSPLVLRCKYCEREVLGSTSE